MWANFTVTSVFMTLYPVMERYIIIYLCTPTYVGGFMQTQRDEKEIVLLCQLTYHSP